MPVQRRRFVERVAEVDLYRLTAGGPQRRAEVVAVDTPGLRPDAGKELMVPRPSLQVEDSPSALVNPRRRERGDRQPLVEVDLPYRVDAPPAPCEHRQPGPDAATAQQQDQRH